DQLVRREVDAALLGKEAERVDSRERLRPVVMVAARNAEHLEAKRCEQVRDEAPFVGDVAHLLSPLDWVVHEVTYCDGVRPGCVSARLRAGPQPRQVARARRGDVPVA